MPIFLPKQRTAYVFIVEGVAVFVDAGRTPQATRLRAINTYGLFLKSSGILVLEEEPQGRNIRLNNGIWTSSTRGIYTWHVFY